MTYKIGRYIIIIMKIENKNIIESIKIMSAAGGLSLADVARAVGDSPQSLNQRLKTGKIQKDFDYMQKIAEVCGFEFKYEFLEKKSSGEA